jgi:hypothetical protein
MSYSSSTSQPQQRNHQLFQELHKLTASVVQTTKVDSKAAISLLSQVELGNYYEADAVCVLCLLPSPEFQRFERCAFLEFF